MSDNQAHAPLKLYAREQADLQVVSALLQDAVLQIGDIAHLPDERRLVLMVNRYCHELPKARLRVRAALQINDVLSMQSRNLNRDRDDGVLSLLAVTFAPDKAPAGEIRLVFSGRAEIRLAVEACDAILQDVTAPWAAHGVPHHDVLGSTDELDGE